MTARLTGHLVGPSREAIMIEASARSAAYFGTECVAVELSNERTHSMLVDTFLADFAATEHHVIEVSHYGPDRCAKCGRESWPQQPLPGVLR